MKRLFAIFASIVLLSSSYNIAEAQPTYGSLPPIRVDGNQLRDEAGNKVVLHGIMDTPSPYFNSWRWGNAANDANANACVTYFNRLFKAETDHSQGAYCNLFRLHLDPCWTNDNAVNAKGFTTKDGKTIDPLGQEVGGEADVHHYSGAKLTRYLKTVYWRIAQQALKNGMYVIMRPPGVCPGDIQVGTYYQDYLIDVWDRVTKNDSILKYYGHVGLELANEPVRIRNKNGAESGDERFKDFFQPIVDKIRANGFKGIIWIPGGIWQQEYKPYAKFPIIDPLNNIGYAVHNYPGWYNNSDNNCVAANTINAFQNSIPVVHTNPIVITEVDWSPPKPGTGHYNESGKWVESNYGTWATGSTSKWGKAYKALLDHFGNVSMTLSGSHCYFDWDTYKNSNYKTVVPAFPGVKEACGEACFQWYEEYSKVDYPSFEFYQEASYPENPFELSDKWFIPNILLESTAKHASSMSTLTAKKGGFSGWRFDIGNKGLDLSGYKSLTVTLAKNASKNTFFRIYDNSGHADLFGDYMEVDFGAKKEQIIDLNNMVSKAGNKLDPAHIRIAGFTSTSADQAIYIKSLTLQPADADAITSVTSKEGTPIYYTIDGMKLNGPQKGINIVKYKNGQTKKIVIK